MGSGGSFDQAHVMSHTSNSEIYLDLTTGEMTVSAYGASVISVDTVPSVIDTTEYIGINSTLPVIITLPWGTQNQSYTVINELGQDSGPIALRPQTGQMINNSDLFILGTPDYSATVTFYNNAWHIQPQENQHVSPQTP
jgi:hypothetical protein